MWTSRAISARACCPARAGQPIDTVSCLPAGASGLAETWRHSLLRDPREAELCRAELGLVRPFSDPALVRRAARYSDFLHEACSAGVVTLDKYAEATVGIYFVAEKTHSAPCHIQDQTRKKWCNGGALMKKEEQTACGKHYRKLRKKCWESTRWRPARDEHSKEEVRHRSEELSTESTHQPRKWGEDCWARIFSWFRNMICSERKACRKVKLKRER